MKIIEGGVCAAKGFTAGSIRCGIKESRTSDDTAVIFSACECTAAATYTMNRVKAAPLYVTMEHLENGVARAIIANAGNANACAPDGMENARRMASAAAHKLGIDENDVVVASTGVIGQRLPVECIETHLPEIVLSDDASEQANRAIMTTDTRTKTAAVEFTVGG
ncbi:MAG: bifunctional ornithine acetyltransferase/N-acetylglutamate synthase, partial [Agathobaculum sp.]|uniref:bifunctional ornithine acetyltransferase/N-acetylglutamate synthase n=1 Tax=Agathobaculum sp. TaxID=2048138 RepID=UPI003D947030